MEKLLIGNTGFDFLSVTGFSVPDEQISIFKRRFSSETLFFDHIKISATGNITIKEPNFFDFRLFKSNLDHIIYGYITLYSARPDGINLENMTLERVFKKMEEACTFLRNKYSLSLQYDTNKLFVSSCELNRTITALDDISAYHRIFALFAFATISGHGTAYTALTEKLKGALSTQGLLCQRSTYRYRIYDKSTHIHQTHGGITFDKRLLRVEKTYLQKQAFLSDFRTLRLVDLTDTLIDYVFSKKMEEIEKRIYQYINTKLTYHPGLIGRNTTVPNILTSHTTYGEIIGDLLAYETQYGLPCLFDLQDITTALKVLTDSGIWSNTNTTIDDCYAAFRDSFTKIANAKGLWEDQYTLMNDFFDKLKSTRMVEVKMWN